MREVTRAEIEGLVEALDRKVRQGELGWKTAGNLWGLVTKLFDDARRSKRRDLRVREDDPTEGVRGPDRGPSRARNYLYPSEFSALIGCRGVEPAFRRLYAVAVFTYARAGELLALTWEDVDLEHGVIHIAKAVDRDTGKVKSTKTGATRRIPVEAGLLPLLRRMRARHEAVGGKASDRCLWLPGAEERAVRLREHLERAGVTRPGLFRNDGRQRHVTFHDLRATGITWMAVRGDDPLRIKQRAGHSAFTTTEGYIREAENLSAGFGQVFPELPGSLTGARRRTVGVGPDRGVVPSELEVVAVRGRLVGIQAQLQELVALVSGWQPMVKG
jgi:integrase